MPRENSEMNIVSNIILCEDEELEFDADCYLFWQDDTKTRQIANDSSNNKKAEIVFNEEGKRHGECVYFSQGEIIERSVMYENGIRNGLAKIHKSNGINGIYGEMYAKDKLVAIVYEENNCILEYSADNSKLVYKYPIEVLTNNQKNGKVLYYQDGCLVSIDLFKNNTKMRTLKSFGNNQMTEYDTNNNRIYEGEYEIDGWSFYRQGWGTEYIQNRTMVFEGSWKNDRRNGKGTSYRNGSIEYEGNWKEGIPHGSGKLNDTNGCWKGEWKDGKLRCIASFDFNTRALSVEDRDGYKLDEMENNSKEYDEIMKEWNKEEEEWNKKEEEWKRKEEEWNKKEEEYKLYQRQNEEEKKKMQLEIDQLTELINSFTRIEELTTVNDYNHIMNGTSNEKCLIKEMTFALPSEETINNSHEQVSISDFSNLEELKIMRLDYREITDIQYTISNNPKLKNIKIKTLKFGSNDENDNSALLIQGRMNETLPTNRSSCFRVCHIPANRLFKCENSITKK